MTKRAKTLPKPIYRDIKFESNIQFQDWLYKTTATILRFEDCGQDFLTWHLADNGEVIHSDMQSSVWNGTMVLKAPIGKRPDIVTKYSGKTKLNYRVVQIEKGAAAQ